MIKGPVVIGGVGGSGTRVVAEMLSKMGYFMGTDLNNAFDNLSYTLLFKRPRWFLKNHKKKDKMFRGLSILEKSMVTGEPFTIKERRFLRRATKEMSRIGHNMEGEGKGQWAYDRLSVIKQHSLPDLNEYNGWGWKEPNTHLLVSEMNEYFVDFKYIHTIRHGLDMAFSSNQQQLFNWSELFHLVPPGDEEEVPRVSLKYWIRANQKIYEIAEDLGDQTILVLNFDQLCLRPAEGIKQLADFLHISLTDSMIKNLSGLPVRPSSAGRYKLYPPDTFDHSDIEEVERLGFDCDY